MDIISINKLKSYCIIGVNEKERLQKQKIFVDIELFGNFKNKKTA